MCTSDTGPARACCLCTPIASTAARHGGVVAGRAPYVPRSTDLLILDATTLDKPYARNIDLVTRHWSGNHHQVGAGSNLLPLVWTDGHAILPGACRVYDTPLLEGHPKHAHFRMLLATANARQFRPQLVCFASWYRSLDNVKAVRAQGWQFLTRLKRNRLVNPDGQGNLPVSTVDIPATGRQVQLTGVGFILVVRMVTPDGDADDWATNDLHLPATERDRVARQWWAIERDHRGLKQRCALLPRTGPISYWRYVRLCAWKRSVWIQVCIGTRPRPLVFGPLFGTICRIPLLAWMQLRKS